MKRYRAEILVFLVIVGVYAFATVQHVNNVREMALGG